MSSGAMNILILQWCLGYFISHNNDYIYIVLLLSKFELQMSMKKVSQYILKFWGFSKKYFVDCCTEFSRHIALQFEQNIHF